MKDKKGLKYLKMLVPLLAIGVVLTLTMVTPVPVYAHTINISPSYGAVRATITVTFPDPNLETAIRQAIGKPSGDIYDTDLLPLTILQVPHKSVSNLSGLEYCTNLQILYLQDNQIADISALASLTKLQTLWLDYNQISNISTLASLTNLQKLDLGNNYKISNISALVNLTKLQTLFLDNNQIADISALVTNQGLASGDDVNLQYNYLDVTAGSQDMADIQTLINRGVNVTYLPQYQFSLSVNTSGQGTVGNNPNLPNYYYGTSVQLTATPAAGWSFAGWSGDVNGNTNTVTITMNGNKTVTANFVGFPSIMVSPVTYSFGNVKVGTSSTGIVTITNTGYANLSVTIGTLSSPFSYTVSGDLSQIAPNDTRWITVTYQPTSAVSSTATLSITSNDPNNPLLGVQLSGTGVPAAIPPSQQITDILTFFNTSVNNGSLVGSGSGNSAQGRLGALKNMITAAGDLINQGRIAEARQQLQDVYLRVDGQPQPPDFATGTAATQLASMIQQLINSL
jgi:uncharacterized repeat protein (TIGR02543 family)